jgi:glycosyltransferase involved in cell wall biosynthesis
VKSKPAFSIVTICLNNRAGLEATLASVARQTERDFEHLIVDGGSTDGSRELLEQHGDWPWLHWASEPDHGIYDALNKGLRRATGRFVIFLNAGDTFCSDDVLANVAARLEPDDDVVYGDAMVVNMTPTGPLAWRKEADHLSPDLRNNVCHQATFFRRELHVQETYDTRFQILGDKDMLMRLRRRQARFRKIDVCVCNYLVGGISSLQGMRFRTEQELLLLRWLNGRSPLTIRTLLCGTAWLAGIQIRVALRRSLGDKTFNRIRALMGRPPLV